jgi:hypothetical protein
MRQGMFRAQRGMCWRYGVVHGEVARLQRGVAMREVGQDKRLVAEARHMQGHTRDTKVSQAGVGTRAIAS